MRRFDHRVPVPLQVPHEDLLAPLQEGHALSEASVGLGRRPGLRVSHGGAQGQGLVRVRAGEHLESVDVVLVQVVDLGVDQVNAGLVDGHLAPVGVEIDEGSLGFKPGRPSGGIPQGENAVVADVGDPVVRRGDGRLTHEVNGL